MNKAGWQPLILFLGLAFGFSCNSNQQSKKFKQVRKEMTAKDILGNPDYLAISYGGYRDKTRDIQPTVEQLKEDMKILSAMNVRILRTYKPSMQKPQIS